MKHKNRRRIKKHGETGDLDDEIEDDYVQRKKWYEEVSANLKHFEPVTEQILIELKDEAKKCLDSEVANYSIKNAKVNSDYRWMKTVTSNGTVSDRIAANTILIQDSPLMNLDLLRNLVSMVKVSKKKECITVMDTLTELFLSDLLRRDSKLKAFHQQPLSQLNEISSGNAVTRKKYLSYWYFEDQLKETYTSFVLALNTAAHDTLDTNKEKAIGAMYRLLAGNPEQEKNLLCYIVNKLGDPSQKVASKAIYCLCQLLYKHSNMQGIVLGEVEKLLFRPNVATRTQYYGLCFLSQFYLSHDSPEIARKLIEVYFAFFKVCIKKGEVDSRMMSALLMGVNRAYPYAKLELKSISEHIDTLYRIVHVANFNIGLHTLSLLYQVSDHANNVNDRFYSALYKKLIDPKLTITTYQTMLLNLVYKALLKDVEVARVKAFIKRLLQLALFMQPAFSCGILFLVSQVMSKKRDLLALELNEIDPVSVKFEDDDEFETYRDVKDDIVIKIEDEDEPTDETGSNIQQSNTNSNQGQSENEPEDIKPDIEILNAENNIAPSWFHRSENGSKKSGIPKHYDPLNRNPLFAGGEHCAYVELLELKNHFHPSVSLFANKILNGETIAYPGDPLKDFMPIRFLDRFVFKNPKNLEETDKKGAHPTFGKRKYYRPGGLRSLAINSANYLNQNEQNIPVDELFVYTFLQKRAQNKQKTEDDDDSDLESVASEEFEEMLDKMIGHKKSADDDDDDDDELDFMNDIGDNLKKQQGKKNKRNVDNDDETDEDQADSDENDFSNDEEVENENEGDELEMDEDDKLLIGDLDDDDDMSEIAFDSDSEESSNSKKKKKKKKDITSVFASAEEFASLLEEEGSAKRAPGSSNAYSNKDNAGLKQVAWEEKQRRWLKGFDKAVGAGGKKGFNKKFGKKRPGSNKFDTKNKKQKK